MSTPEPRRLDSNKDVQLEQRGQGNIYLSLRDTFVPTPPTRSGGLELQLAGQVPGWMLRIALVFAALGLWAAVENWQFPDTVAMWSRPLVGLVAGIWLALAPSGWASFGTLAVAGLALIGFGPVDSWRTAAAAALVVFIYRGTALAARTTAATIIEGTVIWQAVRQALTIGLGAGVLKYGTEVLADMTSGAGVSAGESIRLAGLFLAAVLAIWLLPRVERVRPYSDG